MTAEADNADAVDRDETFTVAEQPEEPFFDIELVDTNEPVTEGDELRLSCHREHRRGARHPGYRTGEFRRRHG
ncbi:hypothetical protein D8S78_24345 [Natrialba swarupiae]|nr:hypothetical protein [Natrialba swarupiae]